MIEMPLRRPVLGRHAIRVAAGVVPRAYIEAALPQQLEVKVEPYIKLPAILFKYEAWKGREGKGKFLSFRAPRFILAFEFEIRIIETSGE